jgi:hypothetical protein
VFSYEADFELYCTSTFNTMARLRNAPKNTLLQDLPNKDKIKLAIQWLRDNLDELPSTAARIYKIQKEDLVQKAWKQERKRMEMGKLKHGS